MKPVKPQPIRSMGGNSDLDPLAADLCALGKKHNLLGALLVVVDANGLAVIEAAPNDPMRAWLNSLGNEILRLAGDLNSGAPNVH